METEILDLESNTEKVYEDASKTKRFVNLLIDSIVFYALAFLLGVFMAIASVDYLIDSNPLLFNVIIYALFVGVYFLLETSLNGKTVGKYITGTRVIMVDGQELKPKNILGRSFARLVPFEAFSFLGSQPTGWHDRWSGTRVIDEKKSMKA
ncbi:MAG: RDD family protein [Flavobacteriales bacterium]|nr:RDD family protein [Flavobacteriales bacterium]